MCVRAHVYVHARPRTCMPVICNKACIEPRGVAQHPVWPVTLYLCLILLRPGPAGGWKATGFQIGTATPGFKAFHSCMASVLTPWAFLPQGSVLLLPALSLAHVGQQPACLGDILAWSFCTHQSLPPIRVEEETRAIFYMWPMGKEGAWLLVDTWLWIRAPQSVCPCSHCGSCLLH